MLTEQAPSESTQKRIEREQIPIYVCGTLAINSPVIEATYQSALQQLSSGERQSVMKYYEGIGIYGTDLSRQEKEQVLQVVADTLRSKNIPFGKCYVDICLKDHVNLGMYFQDGSSLDKAVKKLGSDLSISFIADLTSDGKYKVRGKNEMNMVGHDKSEPSIGLL